MKICDTEVYDTAAVYARIIGLLATGQATLKYIIKSELAPAPPAMFSENGDMRIDKNKHAYKEKLQVETSVRNIGLIRAPVLSMEVQSSGYLIGQKSVQWKTSLKICIRM